MVGKEGTNAEEALQRIVDEGHTLGMHSYSHKYKELYESMDSFTQDFARIRDSIYQAHPEWRVSVTGSRVEAPIRSARSICMILSIIWTVREWNTTTGMCPPETAEA